MNVPASSSAETRGAANFLRVPWHSRGMDSPITDPALWHLAIAGDTEAFGRLYERHAVAVEAFCLRRTADRVAAEEATSEVFLELWRRRQRLTVPGDSARPLLLGIALNVLRHRWRTERRHRATMRRLHETVEGRGRRRSPRRRRWRRSPARAASSSVYHGARPRP